MEQRPPSREILRRQAKGKRGFALVLVLWTTAALSLIAVVLLRETSEEVKSARAAIADARAEALADGGVYRAMAGLVSQGRDQWNADGMVYELMLGDGVARISISDEGGKIGPIPAGPRPWTTPRPGSPTRLRMRRSNPSTSCATCSA